MTNNKFDLEKELENYPCPRMFIAGVKYYINKKNIKINSKKDLDKVVKDYSKLGV